jgi:hypothetical protein
MEKCTATPIATSPPPVTAMPKPTATTAPIPPPSNLTGNWQETSVTLRWERVASPGTEYQYRLYYDSDTSGPPYDGAGLPQGDSPVEIGTAAEYTLDGLEAGTVYYVAVTARDPQGGESYYSNEVNNALSLLRWLYLPLAMKAH